MNRILLYLIIIALVVVVFIGRETAPNFTIETASAVCSTGEQNDLDIRASGNSIVIMAPVATPNPCYFVVGDVKFGDKDIEVDLNVLPKQDACIQCTGSHRKSCYTEFDQGSLWCQGQYT